jgi:CO/xanthine dehydrogenase FAD-binding subunit
MLLNLLEYNWAENIDDALMLLSRPDVKTVPLAGGTYLLGHNDDSIQAVVDLRDLELAYVREDAQGIHIGAMTTLQSMVDAPELKSFASGLLAKSAQASSFSRLIRNSATLGGTLGAGIASQADLLTALEVLDAETLVRSASKTQVNLSGGTAEHPGFALPGVTFKGKQERRIPLSALALERRPNELIMEVRIPPLAPMNGASFMRVGRTPTDVALINAAALVEVQDGRYARVRLALGGINMEPVRLHAVEQQLEGKNIPNPDVWAQFVMPVLQSALTDFRPPSDFRASSSYRQVSGGNLALRVLEEATTIARWRGMYSGGKEA